ncbi:MAG: class I SAM-dependent methyltransferase [Pseudomonadota bacterium]
MPKHERYQDYVIKDGALVGDFEQMYVDHADPWEQTTREEFASEKAVALNLIRKVGAKRVLELGCGFGHYTAKIEALGVQVLGVDISPTAVAKAESLHPACSFQTGDILDFDIYRQFKPDLIVMAEITWYVLDKLDAFLEFLRAEMPDVHLIHLLNTYPPGVQQYGKDKFTNLPEIMAYFGLEYSEWGEITYPEHDGCKRTYFIGRSKDV